MINFFLFLVFILGQTFTRSSAQAQIVSATAICDEKCLHEKSLARITTETVDFSLYNQGQLACGGSGHKLVISSKIETGTILSTESKLRNIESQLKIDAAALNQDSTQCRPGCQQINLVSPVTVTRPIDVKNEPSCENRPTRVLSQIFSNKEAAESYAKDTLRGRNSDGQELNEMCPNPCSFYVYSANTELEDSNIKLNLMVRCGQPRKSALSKYEFSGASVHEWTCQAR